MLYKEREMDALKGDTAGGMTEFVVVNETGISLCFAS